MKKTQNIPSFNIAANKISFDGKNIISSLISGDLMYKFYFDLGDSYQHRIGVINYTPDLLDSSKFGFNLVAIDNNKVIVSANNYSSDLLICELDTGISNIKNTQKIDDKYSMVNPTFDFTKKHNPYKSTTEQYIFIGFINEDFVYGITFHKINIMDENVNIYIYQISTDVWLDYTLINNTDTFIQSNSMIFYNKYDKDIDNLTVYSIVDNEIYVKTLTFQSNNFSVSREAKQFGYYKDNIFYTQSYTDLFEENNKYVEHIIPLCEKEIITTAEITKSKYIIGTTKNIFIKNIEETDDKWNTVGYEFPYNFLISESTDSCIESTTEYDIANKIWVKILSKEDKVIIVALDGKSYYLTKNNDKYELQDTQLYSLFVNDCFLNHCLENIKFCNKYHVKVLKFDCKCQNKEKKE